MLSCLVSILIWCIVAAIILYAIEAVLGSFLPLPPQVILLVRLLIGLLVLLALLDCAGLLHMGFPRPLRGP